MKRWRCVLAAAGAILLVASTWIIRRTQLPRRDFMLQAGNCRVPVTEIEGAQPDVKRNVVIVHGLGANRRVMQTLGSYIARHVPVRAYLFDLPGHGDNTDAFSFARAEQCFDSAIEAMTRNGRIDPQRTAVIGHSMGGAIAIRMADRTPMAATIAISPAPMSLPVRMPSNLLVFSGQYDFWPLKRQAKQLLQAAGGNRTSGDDFRERRAFLLQTVPHATHTSLIFNSQVARQSVEWLDDVLQVTHSTRPLHPIRDAAPEVGLVGLLMMFPLCATAAMRFAGPMQDESLASRPAWTLVLVEGFVCAFGGALILIGILPLRFLRLYGGSYLTSLLLIAGLLLLALNWRCAKAGWRTGARPFIVAAVVGFVTVLACGAWVNWQLTNLWMDAPRWLRFAALLPILWIYCFAEEMVLGPVGTGRARARRFVVFLVLRLELWLACMAGYFFLANGQVLLAIMAPSFGGFSILQRLSTDSLRRRTGSATAAAVFDAILAAWFIAAVFPLT